MMTKERPIKFVVKSKANTCIWLASNAKGNKRECFVVYNGRWLHICNKHNYITAFVVCLFKPNTHTGPTKGRLKQ